MTNPRAIFLNRFYQPDERATAQLLTDLAEALAARGFEPIVITGPAGGAVRQEETWRGVRIRRVPGTRWRETRIASKASNIVTFYVAALVRLLFTARRGDVVTAMTDPPLLGIGVWLIARLRRARVLHWVQDIYPEIAIELSGHRWLGALRPLRNAAWRHADGCVTLGLDMARILGAAGVPARCVHIIRNPAPAGLTPQPLAASSALRSAWELDGKLVAAYSGNLGRVHELDTIIAAAELLRQEPKIVFLFIGVGAQRQRLEDEVRTKGLRNVQFRPPQPRSQLGETLALADLHLVTLRAGCERYVFPSKFHGIVAVGRPLVFVGPPDCELAGIIRAHGLGFAFARAEHAALASTLRGLADDPAKVEQVAARVGNFGLRHEPAGAAVAAWNAILARQQALEAPLPSPINHAAE